MKRSLILTVVASVLTLCFIIGCAGLKPGGKSAKDAERNAYKSYRNSRPEGVKAEPIKLAIPLNNIDDINKKLENVSIGYKLSVALTDCVFRGDAVNALVEENKDLAEKVENKFKQLTDQGTEGAEIDKKLEEYMDGLIAQIKKTKSYKKAQEEVNLAHEKLETALKEFGLKMLKDFLIKQLSKDAVMKNTKIAQLNMIEKLKVGKELTKVKTALNQITYTAAGIGLVTALKTTEISYSVENAGQYVVNSMRRAVTADLSELESVDKQAS